MANILIVVCSHPSQNRSFPVVCFSSENSFLRFVSRNNLIKVPSSISDVQYYRNKKSKYLYSIKQVKVTQTSLDLVSKMGIWIVFQLDNCPIDPVRCCVSEDEAIEFAKKLGYSKPSSEDPRILFSEGTASRLFYVNMDIVSDYQLNTSEIEMLLSI